LAVRDGAREADQPLAVVEADDTRRLADEPLDGIARPSERPVRVFGEERVQGVDIHAITIVVQLEATR
jgi:hypothetical protein